VFGAGAGIFVGGSEWMVRKVFAPRDDFEQYRALFRAANAPTAAFGDSHVANAIASDPQIVNLGNRGETLPLMLSKAEAYVNSGRGKRVILQLAPQQFAVYRAALEQGEVEAELWGGSEPILQFTRPHFRRYLLVYWRTLIGNPGLAFAAPNPVTGEAQHPAKFAQLPAAEQRRSAEIRVQMHAPLPAGPLTAELNARLAAALDNFRSRNVPACIVVYPLSSPYRAGAAKVPAFAALKARVTQIAAAHGARFVDLTEAFPDAMFGDPDHVAADARDDVTRAVVERCFGPARRSVAVN
jgi:hypothetical protein